MIRHVRIIGVAVDSPMASQLRSGTRANGVKPARLTARGRGESRGGPTWLWP